MPDPITASIASAASSAAGRALGPLILGGARSQLERRAVKKRSASAEFPASDEVARAMMDVSPADRAKILTFMKSAEFENLCFEIAISSCMPKNPTSHLDQIRETLEISLRRYSGVADFNIKIIARSLFSEMVALSWQEVNNHQKESGVVKRSLTPEIVAAHIASAARNTQIHRRISDLSDIDQFSARLSEQNARTHGRIRPAQTESGTRVPFDDLYVPSNLTLSDKSPTKNGSQNVRDLLRQANRLVVLGDPGGGKTTLALKLALDVARGLGTGATLQTPLRVVLREYASQYKSKKESIIEYLEKQSKADYSTPAPTGAIEYLLLNGRAVVIFDGLDELTDTSLRVAIVDAVESFTHSYPTTPILVTSRRVGYEMAPLDENLFVVSNLAPFNTEQRRQYVNKWFAHVKATGDEQHMAERFLTESSHAKDLTSNPLMLGLMCALYRGEGYIPRNRPDLYRRCSEFLFERWDASRGISFVQPFERGIQFAMFSLALNMLQNSGETAGMTERELIRYTADYLLGQQYEDHDAADAAADAFVRYCRGRAWVLTDVGTNPDGERIYSFTHRTFLEYFSARQLVRDSGNADSLYKKLRTHLINESWDVTAQLAVQFLDERLGDAANQFVRLALSDAEELSDFKVKSALISFCARLLEFINLQPAVVREVTSALYRVTLSASSMPLDVVRDIQPLTNGWAGLCMCAVETRAIANDALVRYFNSTAGTYDELRYLISLAAFVPSYANAEVREFWAAQGVENARSSPLLSLARHNPAAATEAVLLGLLEPRDSVNWHGPSVLTYGHLGSGIARGEQRNVLYELGHPNWSRSKEENERIAGAVIETLLDSPIPWMNRRQDFQSYNLDLPLQKNTVACRLLTWMLGCEADEDYPEELLSEDPDGTEFDVHDIFAKVAQARNLGQPLEIGNPQQRELLSSRFFEFVSLWSRKEFSLSTPSDDD